MEVRRGAYGSMLTETNVLDALDMMLVYTGLTKKMIRPLPHTIIKCRALKGAQKILLTGFKRTESYNDSWITIPKGRWETLVQDVGIDPQTLTVNDPERFHDCFGAIVGLVHGPKKTSGPRRSRAEFIANHQRFNPAVVRQRVEQDDDASFPIEYARRYGDRDVFTMDNW